MPPDQIGTRCCSASPRCELGEVPARILQLSRSPRARRARGCGDGARGLRVPLLTDIVRTDEPDVAFGDAGVATARRWPCPQGRHGAFGPALGQRWIFKPRARRSAGRAAQGHQGAGGRQPGQHNSLIAMNNAAGSSRPLPAMTRLDHNRAKAQLAQRLGVAGRGRQEDDDLGQPLDDPVPRPVPRRGQRAPTPPRPLVTTHGTMSEYIPTSPRRCGDHRCPWRIVRGVGCQRGDRPHPRLAPGHARGRWVSMAIPSDGSYGVPEGLISSFPCVCVAALRDRAGARDRRFLPAPRSTPRVAELAEERDAVKELGLI